MIGEEKRIKVRSLEFSTLPFRKLRQLKIEFADRLTLIAGHNGIGKSTILGLVANTFGLTDSSDPKSYFGDPFFTSIERIIFLALEEVAQAQAEPSGAPIVMADVNGATVRKRCSMTYRSQWKRARVVPRTIDKQDDDPVGPDAKLPLPTIYLGIRRLAPVGEAEEKDVLSRRLEMPDEDRNLMMQFVSGVIQGVQVTTDVSHQSIKGTRKRTAQPGYADHDSLAVSLGQDSLASIATALASFNKLKRDLGSEYPGGLLIVDELDSGFHPHAIERLVKALKSEARRLNIQVLATTHSPRLIEAVHPDGDGNAKSPDKVVYLLDTKRPRLAEDQSLVAILNDMALRDDEEFKKVKPVLYAHFEDRESFQFFNALFPGAKRGGLGRRLGIQIKLIPLGIGGSHLVRLPALDPIFKNRLLVVDADTKVPRRLCNVVKLPCAPGATSTDRSPENTIRLFLRGIADAEDGPLYEAMHQFTTTNPTTDKILATFFSDGHGQSSDRNSAKAWWNAHWEQLERWGVVTAWATLNKVQVDVFLEALEVSIIATAARVTAGLAKSFSPG